MPGQPAPIYVEDRPTEELTQGATLVTGRTQVADDGLDKYEELGYIDPNRVAYTSDGEGNTIHRQRQWVTTCRIR